MANEFPTDTKDLTLEGLNDYFDGDTLWRTLVDQFILFQVGQEPRPDIMLAYLVQESEKAIAYIKGRLLVTTEIGAAFSYHIQSSTDGALVGNMTTEIQKLLPKLSDLNIAEAQMGDILIEVLTSIQKNQPAYSFLFTVLLNRVEELIFEYTFSQHKN